MYFKIIIPYALFKIIIPAQTDMNWHEKTDMNLRLRVVRYILKVRNVL